MTSHVAAGKPRFLEFFAGAGLARLGLEQDWQCVWANDVSEKKAEVYRANFGDKHLRVGDVAAVDAATLPDAEMAWASFPCQDLSLAGARRGMAGERSGTFWAFWRLMERLRAKGRRPSLIVVENVIGLLHGKDFGEICGAFASLGMRCGALVIDARRFTAQSRPRVFFVASEIVPSALTGPEPAPSWSRPALEAAVGRLPEKVRSEWVWWTLPEPSASSPAIGTVIETRADGWFDDEKVARLVAMMTPTQRAKLDQAVGPRRAVGFLYRRVRNGTQRAEVRFDGLAGCLRTPTGGSSRQTVVMVEQRRVRMRLLTAREAARLMGAPDGFTLPENYNDAYRAMGDGVVVPAVSWLSRGLLSKLIARVASAAA